MAKGLRANEKIDKTIANNEKIIAGLVLNSKFLPLTKIYEKPKVWCIKSATEFLYKPINET